MSLFGHEIALPANVGLDRLHCMQNHQYHNTPGINKRIHDE